MILHGDLFDVLPTLEAESFASGVTDPPYGIGFMGREWDTFAPARTEAEAKRKLRKSFRQDHSGRHYDDPYERNPNTRGRKRSPAMSPSQIEYNRSLEGQRGFQAWTEDWAREVFRVLKPGAHLVVCGAPRSHHRMMCGLEDAGFEIRDCMAWLFGQGFPKSKNLGDGWGTALKPGHEPIVLARKPFKGTTEGCHVAHGTAGLNVDGCRIQFTGPEDAAAAAAAAAAHRYGDQNQSQRALGDFNGRAADSVGPYVSGIESGLGRWPANVLLDDEAAALLDAAGGVFEFGGASRFFYVAKPSREERDLGCEHLAARSGGEATDRKEGSAGLNNPRAGAGRTGGGRNFHPTVKPLALMRWLVRLVTPVGGRVLEPFGGSGTTAMACAAEGFAFTLIEREAEYIPIIEARVRAIAPLFMEA